MKFDKTHLGLATVEQWNLGLSAGAVAASFALVTPHFATSLAAGAFLEAINLGAIHRGAQRFFRGDMVGAGWVGGLAQRFVILGVAIYLTMRAGAHPVAFLIGLSIAMPATVIDAWIHRPPILDPDTLPVLDDGLDERDDEHGRLALFGHLFSERDFDRPEEALRDGLEADPERGPQADSPADHQERNR